MRNKTSNLRKLLSNFTNINVENNLPMNDEDVCSHSKIIKDLEASNYTYRDFVKFDRVVVDNICRKLKVNVDKRNRMSVYRKCLKTLDLYCDKTENDIGIELVPEKVLVSNNSICKSKYVEGEGTELVNLNMVVSTLDDLSTLLGIPGVALKNNSYIDNLGTQMKFEYSMLHSTVPKNEITMVTHEKRFKDFNDVGIMHSTPVPCSYNYTDVIPAKKCKNAYEKVPTPIKHILSKKTPNKLEVKLPRGSQNVFGKSLNLLNLNGGLKVLEGKICISVEEWSSISEINNKGKIQLKAKKGACVFRKLIKTVNNTCVLALKNVNSSEKKFKLKCIPMLNETS